MKIRAIHVLVGILALAGIYFYQDPGANGNSRLDLTRSIAERGSFQIDAYQDQEGWQTIDKAFYEGHYYTDKAIGSSVLALPAYFLLYRLAAVLGLVLDTVFVKHILTAVVMGPAYIVLGIALYRIALMLTEKPWKAFIVALAVSLGTMLWPFSAVFIGHVPAAMFLALAFYLELRMSRDPGRPNARQFFLVGLMMAAAFITDYTTALIVAGLILYAAYLVHKQGWSLVMKSGAAGMLGALIPLALMVAYNLLVYRSVLAFGYAHEVEPRFEQGHATGFMGLNMPDPGALYHLTLDPRFGLFWQSPVLILAVIGYVAAFRGKRFRIEALVSLYSILSIVLMAAGFYQWWGGSAYMPRLLIVALPFFIVPLALLPDELMWLVTSLGLVSAGQMLIPLMGRLRIGLAFDVASNRFTVDGQPFAGFSLLYQAGLPWAEKPLRNADAWWALGWALGLTASESLAAFVAIEAALAVWFRMLVSGKQEEGKGAGKWEIGNPR